MPTATELTIILIFAVIVEMLVEYLIKPLIPEPPADQLLPAPLWTKIPYARYAAALAGVGLSLWYQIDVIAMLWDQYTASPVGMILTGLLISRGSNYVHDWIAQPLFKELIGRK